MEALRFIFSDVWIWIASTITMYVIFRFIINLTDSILRHRTLRKNGYPPIHCDVDGNFREDKEDED